VTATASPPGELEPIETASVDELRVLQLERLRWSLRHAYENVPYYRRLFDIAAVHPDECKDLSDPARCSLKYGIFGAEPWTNEMRAEIEARAGLDATDIYGLSEVIGPGVAQECVETKDGLHVWEDHFYPEVIDSMTGEVLPDGDPGELVFTSLTKQAMPVIRYRTRDLTRLLPGTARTMRRMEKVTGRTDDMIILRGVNLFPTQVEELILGVPALSP
jgi:phenylacetate-CoA ligase